MGQIAEGLLSLSGWAALACLFVLPALEAPAFLGLPYRVFALWTGAAATFWAVAHVLVGYAAGAGWRQVDRLTDRVGLALAGAVVVAAAVTWTCRRAGGSRAAARARAAASSAPSPR